MYVADGTPAPIIFVEDTTRDFLLGITERLYIILFVKVMIGSFVMSSIPEGCYMNKYEQWIEALTSLPTCHDDCPFLVKYGHTGHDAIDARCELFVHETPGLRWDKDRPGEFFKPEHCKAFYLIF